MKAHRIPENITERLARGKDGEALPPLKEDAPTSCFLWGVSSPSLGKHRQYAENRLTSDSAYCTASVSMWEDASAQKRDGRGR